MKVSLATQNRRLLALAQLLDSMPYDAFSYNAFLRGNDRNPDAHNLKIGDAITPDAACGTTACAVGWAPTLPEARRLGYGITRLKFGINFTKNGRRIPIGTFAKQFFGIGGVVFGALFYPNERLGAIRSPDERALATDVAEHIRNFVAIRSAK